MFDNISQGLFIVGSTGYLKSEIDNEPLSIYYDVYGNEYSDVSDVPLYDKYGNTYTHQPEWFTSGSYIDQDGKSLLHRR